MMMNNGIIFLIETLAPYVDRLKVKNPVIYTGLVLGMYAAWGTANHLLTTQYPVSPVTLDVLRLVNVTMPLAMGAIQSRTTSHLKDESKPKDDDHKEL